MGIRRRRKKLTSLLSDTNRRIRSTTLRRVRRNVPKPPADVVEETETTAPAPPVGTVIDEVAPDQWARIVGGYYYSTDLTGGLAQVELFLSENITFSVGSPLYVSGTEVKWNQTKGGKTYSGSFRPNTSATSTNQRVVLKYGALPRSSSYTQGRPDYSTATPPSGAVYSMVYTVANKSEVPRIQAISFRGQVASYSATTTTGTITFTAAHHFVEGHILDISDLPAPFRDIDGIIKVSAVPSSTQISFTFSSPISSSISSTTPSSTSFAYAVVSMYTETGSSWISSVTGKVSIWDGLRWVGYTDSLEKGILVDDGVAPAPPSNLALTAYGYEQDGTVKADSKSAVIVSWNAPTTNAAGATLNDLLGYRIWVSTTSENGPWFQKQNFGLETDQTILGLTPNVIHYFAVIAYDSTGLDSVKVSGEILTVLSALAINTPSTPTVTTRLGTVKVTWDGKDNTGAVTPVNKLARLEVHASTSSGFTPSASTLLASTLNGPGSVVAADLQYNTDYYFRFVAFDLNNRATDPSAQVSAKVLPLVNSDLIAAELNSPLSVWPFAPKTVIAGALADGSLNASTVFGPGVVNQGAIAANAIGADQIAANAITAGKIEAGAITAAKIEALAISTDKIAANAITADKIAVGTITATQISSDYIYAGTIDADQINAGELVGFTIKTRSSGARVELDIDTIQFYDQNGGRVGTLGYNASGTIALLGEVGPNSITGLPASIIMFEDGAMSFGASYEFHGRAGFTELNNQGPYYADGQTLVISRNGALYGTMGTQSTGSNIVQSGTGQILRRFAASSRRYKNSESSIWDSSEFDPHKLLDIPVKIFKYNLDYLDPTDQNYDKFLPGLIAEDVDSLYPAASYTSTDGKVENWTDRSVLVATLALVQELYSKIDEMKIEIDALKGA
jgi:hypothetical protein